MSTEFIITTTIAGIALLTSIASAWYCRRNFNMSRYEFDKRRREEKQADLKAEAVYTTNGKYRVTITNYGKSEARNVVCDFKTPTLEGTDVNSGNLFPYTSLDSGKSINVIFYVFNKRFKFAKFNVTWEDDFSKSNTKELTVCLV